MLAELSLSTVPQEETSPHVGVWRSIASQASSSLMRKINESHWMIYVTDKVDTLRNRVSSVECWINYLRSQQRSFSRRITDIVGTVANIEKRVDRIENLVDVEPRADMCNRRRAWTI